MAGTIGLGLLLVVALAMTALFLRYGSLWIQAYMSGADISLGSLIGMSFRQVETNTIVRAKIMIAQAGLDITRRSGVNTSGLEALFLAGGNVVGVVRSIIIANRAGIGLDFDRAAAIDLAGRDILDAVMTTVSPRVIDCPDPQRSGNTTLSAVAKDGVELRIHARVTVRTNLGQLIGGASEETIIARVGQGIISAVGSAEGHMDVMSTPERISKGLLKRGLDSNTAYEIVSIDIAKIDVGQNIGARLNSEQAEADMRTSRAFAEGRRAMAVANEQEMKALSEEMRAEYVLAQASVPTAIANAFRVGQISRQRLTVHPRRDLLAEPRLHVEDNPS